MTRFSAHGLAREEWLRRFRVRFAERLGETVEALGDDLLDAESANWLDDDGGEWKDTLPEEAADDNLMYWVDG